MFYYLDGTVAEILPYLAVIDCGGVGYACKTTNTTLAQLKKGQRGKLYTYLDVGENAFGLYGFATACRKKSGGSATAAARCSPCACARCSAWPGWRCICSRRADRPGRNFGAHSEHMRK